MKGDPKLDPKGLIEDSFRIEGITIEECRSIFLDWALSVPVVAETHLLLQKLIDIHVDQGDHPMTQVMTEGLGTMEAPRRRGGWRSRSRTSCSCSGKVLPAEAVQIPSH